MRYGIVFLAVLSLAGGCGREPARSGSQSPSTHRHVSPHGGTAVVLGAERYHLEFVRDPVGGAMQAYLLDGHLENFVRIQGSPFAIVVRFAGREEVLQFQPVANPATGETVAETAMFEARAPWLTTNRAFDGVIRELDVRGTRFTNVTFRFPEGNENLAP